MRDTHAKLPVHGFVLAGGKSSRMGRDKALLPFRGRPMVAIAVEKLRGFCSAVSIAGNRDDLSGFAPVVRESRVDCGPAAGIEAGLLACMQPWAIFVPVDVPLVPEELLKKWAEESILVDPEAEEAMGSLMGSALFTPVQRQPAFCMLRRETVEIIQSELQRGERRLDSFFDSISAAFGATSFVRFAVSSLVRAPRPNPEQMELWFSNVNTGQELAEAEARAETWESA